MRTKSKYRPLLVLLVLPVMLYSAGRTIIDWRGKQVTLSSEVIPPMPESGGRTIVDARGKQVTLPGDVRRILVVPIPTASIIIALDGGPKRILGMNPSAMQSANESILSRIYPEVNHVRTDFLRGGVFNLNMETVVTLHPDVVLQWTQPADQVANVERAGLTSVTLITNYSDQELHERNLRIIGAVLGRTKRVEKVIEMQRRIQAEIAPKVEATPEKSRPSVLYLRSIENSFQTSGGYPNFWIELTGGRNVARSVTGSANFIMPISAEQILAWNPDVIFMSTFDAATPQDISSNSRFKGLKAVQNNRVYKIPHGGYRWDPGSHESHLTWQWAANLLQPGLFEFDLRQSIREFYQFIYNYRVSESEIDTILQFSLNGTQSHYGVFRKH